jgi:hypothetical protein
MRLAAASAAILKAACRLTISWVDIPLTDFYGFMFVYCFRPVVLLTASFTLLRRFYQMTFRLERKRVGYCPGMVGFHGHARQP